ncbi:hypothetical protein A1O1_04273 [Capronia coronata CBS 617.96]|uniref:Mid2 domain-containing protein n=1 Tax=Capronia coronata CBS 617.96 TaxID=1182541 RepID=W9Z9H1_9EURO|nr:uncharacterized protein A1O1_04273 [Capronia coronata CBS 617.96]EXJ91164.1 hypothetical protein A1O1_04273 [Capronia coronata CBS 617.96]
MRRLNSVVLFYFVRYSVNAAPIEPGNILDHLDPLKSVASDIFGIPTALAGLGVSANTVTTPSPSAATSSTISAGIPAQSAASAEIPALQSSVLTTGSSVTTTSQPQSIPLSRTVTQLLTDGVATPGSTTGSFGTTTTQSVNNETISATSSSTAAVSVVPTTTGSSSATSLGSSSSTVSGSGSGSLANSQTSGGLSPAKRAVTVILPILALIMVLFFLWRNGPSLHRRYTNWRQQRLERRAYRKALDDPVLSFGVREKGLGLGDVEQIMRPLSFGFQKPHRQGIRRKSLNWDATCVGADGISGIGMAVPLGEQRRTESDSSEGSHDSRYEDARLEQT